MHGGGVRGVIVSDVISDVISAVTTCLEAMHGARGGLPPQQRCRGLDRGLQGAEANARTPHLACCAQEAFTVSVRVPG